MWLQLNEHPHTTLTGFRESETYLRNRRAAFLVRASVLCAGPAAVALSRVGWLNVRSPVLLDLYLRFLYFTCSFEVFYFISFCLQCFCLQCFDAVGWAAGRASDL